MAKSETRVSFEKKFAAERRKRIKAGKPGDGGVFTFRGKKYTTDYAKTKKKAAPKKKVANKKDEYWNPTANKTSKYAGTKRKKTKENTNKDGTAKFIFGKKDKKRLGGFRDTFVEPGIESLD